MMRAASISDMPGGVADIKPSGATNPTSLSSIFTSSIDLRAILYLDWVLALALVRSGPSRDKAFAFAISEFVSSSSLELSESLPSSDSRSSSRLTGAALRLLPVLLCLEGAAGAIGKKPTLAFFAGAPGDSPAGVVKTNWRISLPLACNASPSTTPVLTTPRSLEMVGDDLSLL